jgi:hypothetical protein
MKLTPYGFTTVQHYMYHSVLTQQEYGKAKQPKGRYNAGHESVQCTPTQHTTITNTCIEGHGSCTNW